MSGLNSRIMDFCLQGSAPYGFRIGGGDGEVVTVARIRSFSKAEQEGLKEGDVILSINDVITKNLSYDSVFSLTESNPDLLKLKILRGDDNLEKWNEECEKLKGRLRSMTDEEVQGMIRSLNNNNNNNKNYDSNNNQSFSKNDFFNLLPNNQMGDVPVINISNVSDFNQNNPNVVVYQQTKNPYQQQQYQVFVQQQNPQSQNVILRRDGDSTDRVVRDAKSYSYSSYSFQNNNMNGNSYLINSENPLVVRQTMVSSNQDLDELTKKLDQAITPGNFFDNIPSNLTKGYGNVFKTDFKVPGVSENAFQGRDKVRKIEIVKEEKETIVPVQTQKNKFESSTKIQLNKQNEQNKQPNNQNQNQLFNQKPNEDHQKLPHQQITPNPNPQIQTKQQPIHSKTPQKSTQSSSQSNPLNSFQTPFDGYLPQESPPSISVIPATASPNFNQKPFSFSNPEPSTTLPSFFKNTENFATNQSVAQQSAQNQSQIVQSHGQQSPQQNQPPQHPQHPPPNQLKNTECPFFNFSNEFQKQNPYENYMKNSSNSQSFTSPFPENRAEQNFFKIYPNNQPPNQPFNQPLNQPFNQPPNQPINQPQNQPFNQPPNQPINQPQNQPFNQPPNQPFNQPPNQPFNQPPNQPFKQPPNQPFNQPPNQPFNQPPIQPKNQPPNQPFNQPPNQPFNQPPNQPFNQSPYQQPLHHQPSEPSFYNQPSQQPHPPQQFPPNQKMINPQPQAPKENKIFNINSSLPPQERQLLGNRVNIAKGVALSVMDEANQNSKGQRMFIKRRDNAYKWTVQGPDPVVEITGAVRGEVLGASPSKFQMNPDNQINMGGPPYQTYQLMQPQQLPYQQQQQPQQIFNKQINQPYQQQFQQPWNYNQQQSSVYNQQNNFQQQQQQQQNSSLNQQYPYSQTQQQFNPSNNFNTPPIQFQQQNSFHQQPTLNYNQQSQQFYPGQQHYNQPPPHHPHLSKEQPPPQGHYYLQNQQMNWNQPQVDESGLAFCDL